MEIHTNNLVESWHSILKSNYLRGYRRQRTDVLVYRLLREVLPDLRLKIARIIRGFEKRKLDAAEERQLTRCNELSSVEAARYVQRCLVALESDDDFAEVITVKSFNQKKDVFYTISLNASSSLSRCNCLYMTRTRAVCKHMFLAERQLGYSICYTTKDHVITAEHENFPPAVIERSHADPIQGNEHSFDDLLADVEILSQFLKNRASELPSRFSHKIKRIKLDMSNMKDFLEEKDKTLWSQRQRR